MYYKEKCFLYPLNINLVKYFSARLSLGTVIGPFFRGCMRADNNIDCRLRTKIEAFHVSKGLSCAMILGNPVDLC